MRRLSKSILATSLASLVLFLPVSAKTTDTAGTVKFKRVEYAKTLPSTSITPLATLQPVGPPSPCGADPEMAYIYKVESGCRATAVNPGGCKGLGQSCPASKIAQCGDDWFCQDKWFRGYAVSAYGSIHAAYLFRTSHNWW